MAEESKKDNSQQMLQARLDEQSAKARIMVRRLMEISHKDLNKEAREFGRFMEFIGQVQADSSWITSMMKVGVAHDTILKVWYLKDQKKRDSKNPENPPNK